MPTSMNDAPAVLEYEVTADDLRRFVRESRRRLQRIWTRRIAGLVALLMGLYFAADGEWLLAALCLLLSANYWFGWLYWLLWWVSSRYVAVREPYQCRIEVDDRGLVMTATPSRSPQRFWWRSLRLVQDEPEGLELDFGGGMVLCIPRKAFATAEQYAEFRGLVNDRLAPRRAVAAAG
jgi:hypothetical protein